MLKVERSARSFSICNYRLHGVLILMVGFALTCAAPAKAAVFPSVSGGGFFTYDGTSLTLDASTSLDQVFYSFSEFAFFSWQDPAIGGVVQLTGVSQIGSSLVFTDGTFSVTVGSDVILTADIIATELVPTSTHTADINPGLSTINLQNVVVSQPTSGSSRLVTDWLAASGGSGLGSVGLTLANTDAGSLDPLVAPAGGNVLFTLEPAVPEPISIILLFVGGGCAIQFRRRRG